MFCDNCDRLTHHGFCVYCDKRGRNGEKIVAGAVVGGLLGGPLGILGGALIGSILGEREEN